MHFINSFNKGVNLQAPRKQFLRIEETFLWYSVKEKISLNWRKFCWFKQIFFSVNKYFSLDQKNFFWINKTFFNSKLFLFRPYIKEMFLQFKKTVFSVIFIYNFYPLFASATSKSYSTFKILLQTYCYLFWLVFLLELLF